MNRWDDITLKKLKEIWPILVAGAMLVAAYAMKSETLEATAVLAKETAKRVEVVETSNAVLISRFDSVEKKQDKMDDKIDRMDDKIGRILRAVRE